MSASQAKGSASSSPSEISSPVGAKKRYPAAGCELPGVNSFPSLDVADSKKSSPSNQDFLTTLRKFNIDRSRYKHYGHKSSLNANSLEMIMNETSEATSTETPTKVIKKEEDNANAVRAIIDQRMAEALGLPQGSVDGESLKPYSVETLHDMMRLQIEKEKTKQESYRSEFGHAAVELFKLAQANNIDSELIPLILLGHPPSTDLRGKMNALQNDPNAFVDSLTSKADEAVMPLHRSGSKRKFSDTHLPSFSETAESIKGSVPEDSPIRSPVRSPIYTHTRINSDESEALEKISQSSTTLHKDQSFKSKSQQSSPLAAARSKGSLYPVYYGPGSAVPSTAPSSNHAADTSNQTSVGSPYPQKYVPVLLPAQQGHYQNAQRFVPQQPYPYYMSSSNNNPYSYPLYPPYSTSTITSPVGQHRQSPDSQHNVQQPLKYGQDDYATHKKQKTSAKNNINFMITTPKNPPARKYNNPKEKKLE